MTNHWRDIKNTDLILINGANPAEAHPVGFQWFMRAKLDRGAKIIHTDPRFTRTSAVADMYVRIRTGTVLTTSAAGATTSAPTGSPSATSPCRTRSRCSS